MLISLEKECRPTFWRQALRRNWKLPRNCHTSILHMLTVLSQMTMQMVYKVVSRITEWFNTWLLKLNINKCKVVWTGFL